jgi:hypothetical protein
VRVVMERRGGFAGLRRTARLEAPSLAPEEEAKLRQALDRAGFFGLPADQRATRPRPDQLEYRLEVEDGSRRHSVRADEDAASDALKEVFAMVEELTRVR